MKWLIILAFLGGCARFTSKYGLKTQEENCLLHSPIKIDKNPVLDKEILQHQPSASSN